MSAERPLTDAQERALIWLVDRARDDLERGTLWRDRLWHRCRDMPGGYKPATLEILRERGFVQLRYHDDSGKLERHEWQARATYDGLKLCDSMGD